MVGYLDRLDLLDHLGHSRQMGHLGHSGQLGHFGPVESFGSVGSSGSLGPVGSLEQVESFGSVGSVGPVGPVGPMRKLLMVSLKQVNLRIFLSCIVWMTIWATNFVLQMLERVVMLQLLQVTVSLSSFASLMVMLHTMQEAVRLICIPMQRPLMVLSFISGVVRLMFCKSSISWGSVDSLVFKYLTSSKMPSFNCLKWYVFPHEFYRLGLPTRTVLLS